jgi:opacity protein-like surface antigen
MKKFLVLAVLALALVATPAMAKEGPYVGIGLTYVNIGGDSWFDTIDPATGLELRVGYNFGSIALEGNFIGSTHEDSLPGYSDGDFRGASIDLRISFSQQNEPTQVYALVGLGAYSFEQTDIAGNDWEFEGGGFNLGIGFEHFFNEQVAIDVRGVYRFINYDLDQNGVQAATDLDGDTFTLGVGLNLHF